MAYAPTRYFHAKYAQLMVWPWTLSWDYSYNALPDLSSTWRDLRVFSHSDDLPGAFCLGILDDLAAKPKGFDWPQQHHHSLRASFQPLLRGWCHCGRTFVVPLQRGGRSGSSRSRVVSQIEPLQGWFLGCWLLHCW